MKLNKSLIVILLLCTTYTLRSENPNKLVDKSTPLEIDYSHSIIKHCKALSEKGIRNVGSENLVFAENYILKELESIGLNPEKEDFKIETFVIKSQELNVNSMKFTPEFIAFNPYSNQLKFEEIAVIADVRSLSSIEVENRCVITNNPQAHFMLITRNPKLIICISESDFSQLGDQKELPFSLEIKGYLKQLDASNISVKIGPENCKKEVYVMAHMDSYNNSPGANDNGTGIGAAIEMARYFKALEDNLSVAIRIIFFGGEEVGCVGSKHYVSNHLGELNNCKMALNMDTFGGNDAVFVAANPGVSGVPENGIADQVAPILKDRTWEALDGSWRIQHPSVVPAIMATNYPEWLQKIVQESAEKTNIAIKQRHLMSDHQSFAQAGVPSISIQSRDHTIHVPEDTVDKLNSKSINDCFRLSLAIIEGVIGDW